MEYKEIRLGRIENSDYIESISQILSVFPTDDILLEANEGECVIKLRRLDFRAFRNHVISICDKANDSDKRKLFMDIIERIENIRSYGLDGKKRLYVGYNRERKVKNREGKERKRGAYFYAQKNNFSTKNNRVPEEFIDKIICGDSEIELKKLPDNCIDLVLTSPPYNFGLEYSQNQDDHKWEVYFDKLFRVFDECIRILKYGGRIIINVQPLFSDYIPSHHLISNYFINKGLIWKCEILWEKHNYNCKYTAWGSWKSPSNPYLKYTWEFLEIFCKGSLKKTGNNDNIDIEGEEFKKWVFAKWSISPERKMREFEHPAMFPEELVERSLKLFSYKRDIVLDPFNGVGTTTCVAKRLNRSYLGIDISPEYCQKAMKRTDVIQVAPDLFRDGQNGSVL